MEHSTIAIFGASSRIASELSDMPVRRHLPSKIPSKIWGSAASRVSENHASMGQRLMIF